MISLTIMAFIFGVMGSGFHLIGTGWAKRSETASRQDMLIRGLDIIRRDVEGLERQLETIGETPVFIFDGNSNDLQFVVIEPRYPTRSGPYHIHYSVKQGADSSFLMRDRTPFGRKAGGGLNNPVAGQVSLIEGEYKYRFSYMGSRSHLGKWVSRWNHKTQLPVLIKFEILDRKTARPIIAPMIVRPRHDAEQLCTLKGLHSARLPATAILSKTSKNNDKGGGKNL